MASLPLVAATAAGALPPRGRAVIEIEVGLPFLVAAEFIPAIAQIMVKICLFLCERVSIDVENKIIRHGSRIFTKSTPLILNTHRFRSLLVINASAVE